ncbi:adhesin biosynthesis transcription regulatory family protein [Yersinia enterocolitica]|uniref:adhesin biosynthesis transcription regulatory family protein n=1 Tax=Yersinia enterocolitica TaxID=630 RepID=UPI002413F199|nr:adhesin biosynthesis transcription regulatory family protein [Yersinia enterocolitica]
MMVNSKKMALPSPLEKGVLMTRIRRGMLVSGCVDEEQFWLLIDISSMHSNKMIQALRDYLVLGVSRKEVRERYNVNDGYFSTSLNRLQHISYISAQLATYYIKEAGAS